MRTIIFILALCLIPYARAWDGHFVLTYLALKNFPELQNKILSESLGTFLKKEQAGIAKLLDETEQWSQKNILFYPPLPTHLQFKKTNDPKKLQTQFLMAIRVNLNLNFPLFVQYPIGEIHPKPSLPLAKNKVMLDDLAKVAWIYIGNPPLEKIKEGELVSPLQVIATASDEPDYGMDLDLWENNFSWFRLLYKWGKQPFGNDKVIIGTQAPFHMAFYYEPSIVNKLASNFLHTYSVYRHHLYLSLAKYAFQTGHPYWGFRFLGWSLHYAQDLTQPYHSTLAPNVSIAKLLYVNFLDQLGKGEAKQNLTQLITNRHYALENYTYHLLSYLLKNNQQDNPFIMALTDESHDKIYPVYNNDYLEKIIAKESNEMSEAVDQSVRNSFPAKYVMDPKYIFYVTEPDINLFGISGKDKKIKTLNDEIVLLLKNIGSHTRNIYKIIPTNQKAQTPKSA